jgi:UDP-glucose 4-epimerase
LPVVLFRLFNTVGPRQSGQYGMVVPRFVQWALAGEPIQVYGDGEQTRCFCNVNDVIEAIYLLSQSEEAIGQLFNIGSDEEISIKGLAERIVERAGSNSKIEIIPYEQAYSAPGFEDFRRRVPSVAKLQKATNWQRKLDLNQTIDQTIAYYREKMQGKSD